MGDDSSEFLERLLEWPHPMPEQTKSYVRSLNMEQLREGFDRGLWVGLSWEELVGIHDSKDDCP